MNSTLRLLEKPRNRERFSQKKRFPVKFLENISPKSYTKEQGMVSHQKISPLSL